MLLYLCEKCGVWLDRSLVNEVINRWNAVICARPELVVKGAQRPSCPAGHGLMQFISPKERLMLRPQEPKTKPEPDGGKILTYRPRPGIEITLVPLTTDELKKMLEERGPDESA